MLQQFCTHPNKTPGSNGVLAFAERLQVQDVQLLVLAVTRTRAHTHSTLQMPASSSRQT
jgi:hypothetical protein